MHGTVSPQSHTEFNDGLLTVPIERTLLSLQEKCSLNGRLSSNTQLKIAITTEFELAESWLAGSPGEVTSDSLSDPLLLCLINTTVNVIDGIAQGIIPGISLQLISSKEN